MRLEDVVPGAGGAAGETEIRGLAYDNRTAGPGDLFFCVRGFTRDGHDFAADAVAQGVAGLVVDHRLDLEVPQVVVPDVRAAMAPAAAAFYGDPTDELALIGVTGTNGKTTTAHLVRSLLEAAGRQTGLLGTVTSIVGGREHPVERTTPEAIDLQMTFRRMVNAGDVACAMEISSHALALHRVDAIRLDVGIFTNLTQDHLDFHPTMEDYYLAKRRLFDELRPSASVINLDDPYGRRLASEFPSALTYGLERDDVTFGAHRIETGLGGSRFLLRTPAGEREIRSPLRGRFNVLNVLAALAAADALGLPPELAADAVAGAAQVPGRFETVDEGQPFAVIVDYAHTPDSLENVLQTARGLADGRLHVVFGCGGDRDRGKRPLMGEIAARLTDRVIVTSDNPRGEDPAEIVREILAGIPGPVEHDVDRARAIRSAVAGAAAGDVVIIAGKGHEQGQEFANGRKIPFDDVTEARKALRALL